jgi:hypothetical protein
MPCEIGLVLLRQINKYSTSFQQTPMESKHSDQVGSQERIRAQSMLDDKVVDLPAGSWILVDDTCLQGIIKGAYRYAFAMLVEELHEYASEP